MRHKIWKKGDFFEIGGERIDMDPAVVEIPDSVHGFWVVWNFDYNKKPIGKFHDVRLEDGEITGTVEWFEKTLNDDSPEDLFCRFGGYYSHVEKNEDSTVVTKCFLRAVSLIPNAAVPVQKGI